ncbi:hypothetical protein BCR44DRAFT_1534321 [Catenaria anguillulae PL171]|uniref:Uncharacterized protein n=1 Tax=Catenaria anguillulae PL171 TaxID=765915 RepID=A0A1Y2HG94_9FUNG|nr:hypothetical protein BCR44DRAFT_1534321 [Catenaria anguillulae PL171]
MVRKRLRGVIHNQCAPQVPAEHRQVLEIIAQMGTQWSRCNTCEMYSPRGSSTCSTRSAYTCCDAVKMTTSNTWPPCARTGAHPDAIAVNVKADAVKVDGKRKPQSAMGTVVQCNKVSSRSKTSVCVFPWEMGGSSGARRWYMGTAAARTP